MNRIIQCPSCNTKFALNSNQLAGIESPKFHCSRCNTIFSVENQEVEKPTNFDNSVDSSIEENNYFETDQNEEQEESIFEDTLNEDDFKDSEILDNEEQGAKKDSSSSSEFFLDEDEFEDPEIEVDLTSFTSRISNESFANPARTDDHKNIQQPGHSQGEWKIGELSGSQTAENAMRETQMTLNYQEDEADDSLLIEEGIEIDWPTDDGSRTFEVNLTEQTKKNVGSPPPPENSPDFTRPVGDDSLNEAPLKNEPNTKEYERPEVKSLLASLIGDDIDEAKHKVHNTPPPHKIPTTSEVALIPDDDKILPPSKDHDEGKIEPIPEDSTTFTSQNRSFKETTVLKRDQISFTTMSDVDNQEDDNDDDLFNLSSPKRHYPTKTFLSKFENLNFNIISNGGLGVLKTFSYAWSLPILMLVFLAWFSNSITTQKDSKYPSFSKNVIEALGLNKPPNDILPPNDVVVSKLDGMILDLNSGERIVLTTGNILNMGSQSYRNIKLESRIFDKNQISLTRKITEVPNKLTREFIKSKNFDVLDQQQNTPLNASNNEVLQKTITEFSMAIDITGLEKDLYPKFFGVRVYSIGK